MQIFVCIYLMCVEQGFTQYYCQRVTKKLTQIVEYVWREHLHFDQGSETASSCLLAMCLPFRVLGEQSQFYCRCGRTCARPTRATKPNIYQKPNLKRAVKQRQILLLLLSRSRSPHDKCISQLQVKFSAPLCCVPALSVRPALFLPFLSPRHRPVPTTIVSAIRCVSTIR